MGLVAHPLVCVGHGDAQAHGAHPGQIEHVVTHEGGLLGAHAGAAQALQQPSLLVVPAEQHVVDAQVPQPPLERRRGAPGDHRQLHALVAQQPQAEPIMGVERLHDLAIGAVVQPSVRQHAVCVQHQEAHSRSLGAQLVRQTRRVALAHDSK